MSGKKPEETRLVYSTGGSPPEEPRRPRRQGQPPSSSSEVKGGGVRLRLDRRASGRIVTVVSGLPGTVDQVAELLRQLKAACGSGGTLKDGALELQGDHRDKVEEALGARGIRSKRAGG